MNFSSGDANFGATGGNFLTVIGSNLATRDTKVHLHHPKFDSGDGHQVDMEYKDLNNWINIQKIFENKEVLSILDNSPSHKSKEMMKAFKKLNSKILFLTVYSPNLGTNKDVIWLY